MSYKNYDDYRGWGDQDLDFDGCLECGNKRSHKKNCRYKKDLEKSKKTAGDSAGVQKPGS